MRKGKYKVRKDGSIRKFGGVNVLMYGDFWQLKPVGGAWLCCNPMDIPGSGNLAQKAVAEIFLTSEQSCLPPTSPE